MRKRRADFFSLPPARALRISLALLLCVVLTPGAAADDASPDPLLWTYQYLLATAQTEREISLVTDRASEDLRVFGELPEHALPDFVAEVLLERLNDPGTAAESKRRLYRVLNATDSRRYLPVYARIASEAQDPFLARRARYSQHRWLLHADDAYQPGAIDIHSMVTAAEAAALAARPTAAQRAHFAAFHGDSIPELFAWAGMPHHVSSEQKVLLDLIVDMKLQRIAFYYRGQGRVVFALDLLSHAWQLKSLDADPLAFEAEFPYRARAAQLGLPDEATLELIQLVNGSPLAMRAAVMAEYRHGTRPLEFLDTAAEILATASGRAMDGPTIDAHAWICKLLAQHGGPRYAAILAHVAESADPKLRRYAQQEISTRTHVTPEPYVAGSVDLRLQRAKYRSPYLDESG